VNKNLVSDNQLLTNELILAQRDLQKYKSEHKTVTDSLKKTEKECTEQKKLIQSKDGALEKLRKENEELWTVVNTDKYKSVRSVEQEKEKVIDAKKTLQEKLNGLQQDYDQLKAENESLQSKTTSSTFESDRLRERDAARETIIKTLEDRVKNHEAYAAKSEQLLA
jgi:chromosome segregation ATPase